MEYRIIIVNLTRRRDRWDYIYQKHLDNGVPPNWIERWPARDARDWHDGSWKKGHPFPDKLRDAALLATNNTAFLNKSTEYLGDYCWHWTYYEALMHIACREPDKLYILMVDDWRLKIDHESLLEAIEFLMREDPDFRLMTLYAYGDGYMSSTRLATREHRTENMFLESIVSNLTLSNHMRKDGDAAILMSRTGAALLLEMAKHAEPSRVSELVMMTYECDEESIYHANPSWAYCDSTLGDDRLEI